jgi:hypothetical protein
LDDDHRIGALPKLLDAFLGRLHPAFSFEGKWFGNDRYRQNSLPARRAL